MAVAGDLADLSLADLLYMFKTRAMTGRLTLRRDGEDAVLHLREGRLVLVVSSRVSQRLGDLLIHMGKLTAAELSVTLLLQASSQGTAALGTLLVEQNLATPEDIHDVLTCQAEEILYRVLTWSEGTFSFVPELPAAAALPLPEINIDRLILEAIRQADEWESIRARIPNLDYSIILNREQVMAEATTHFSLKESIVIASIVRGATDLHQVAEATGLSEPDLLRLVDGLASRDLLTITATEKDASPAKQRHTIARRLSRRHGSIFAT